MGKYTFIKKREKMLFNNKIFIRVLEFFKAVKLVYQYGPDVVFRDGGTGLFIKFVFKEMALKLLQFAMRTRTSISLVMADMNDLRKINSLYGHQQGDNYLQVSAKIFTRILRETDIAGRYGGDEFIIILPNTNKDGAMVVVNKLRARLTEEKIGWSFGVAEAQLPSKSDLLGADSSFIEERWKIFLEDLIAEADKDLYRDKASKK